MDVRSSSFHFPSTEGDGPQPANAQFAFPRAVRQVAVGITGYTANFEEREDHHLGRLIVELNASVNGDDPTKVDVSGSFGLRDWSGNWDDPYGGLVEYTVFADLVGVSPPTPGNPRGDLFIVDAEITQAIQHFRSGRHLDAANVLPDNSIQLVAFKPTVVRLYVDYDASSGLARIGSLYGELTVTAAGAATTILASRPIVPRRDASIDRGQRDHTLNFLIPENLCRGAIDISARVFDAFDRNQFSVDFVRTLTFESVPSLPVMAVAIDYTGPDVSDPSQVSAPTIFDFPPLFVFTEAVYPIPQVLITSFVTMTYDGEVKSDINEGCDKLDDLKDAVADLRGDSDDIVYGLFNAGLDTGSVGGCGGGGVGVGRIGAQTTAAHEVGHALGRKHAPCDNVTRCAEPKNTDDDYPRYLGFDSDSIGEYGFDMRPAFGSVKSPANAHDMMGYSSNDWISPHTYKALLSRIPEIQAGASAAFAASASEFGAAAGRKPEPRGCWIPIKQPQLFLRIDIRRDRSVIFHPSFQFDARPRPHGAGKTDFAIELLDGNDELLRSSCLYADEAGCGCCCGGPEWPLKIRHAISFDPRARTLVLYECDKEIARWPVPEAPKVSLEVEGADSKDADLELRWDASAGSADERPLWYLVQWRDARGTWRGAAPRTRETSLKIPRRLFDGQRVAAVRVLASAGIATGVGVWEGPIRPPDRPPGARRGPEITISIAGVEARKAGAHEIEGALRATVISSAGSTSAASELRWYDARGAEIGRGRSFDPARLPAGQHTITAVSPRDDHASATWLVERTRQGRTLVLVGDQKQRLSPRRTRGAGPTRSEG